MSLNPLKSRVVRTEKLPGTRSCSDFKTTVRSLDGKLVANTREGPWWREQWRLLQGSKRFGFRAQLRRKRSCLSAFRLQGSVDLLLYGVKGPG